MSVTIDYTTAVEQAFSLDQLATLLTWSAGQVLGLKVSMAFAQEGSSEVAEVSRNEPREVLYLLSPTKLGTVMMAGAYAGQRELSTVEAALAEILELSQIEVDRQKSLNICFIEQLHSTKRADWSDVAIEPET